MSFRSCVRVLFAALAIAGTAGGAAWIGGGAAAEAGLLRSAAVEEHGQSGISIPAGPADQVATLTTGVELAVRSGSSTLRLAADPPGPADLPRGSASVAEAGVALPDAARALDLAELADGRWARSGATSTFGTSLPPPFLA